MTVDCTRGRPPQGHLHKRHLSLGGSDTGPLRLKSLLKREQIGRAYLLSQFCPRGSIGVPNSREQAIKTV
jgi:hypothetical protein